MAECSVTAICRRTGLAGGPRDTPRSRRRCLRRRVDSRDGWSIQRPAVRPRRVRQGGGRRRRWHVGHRRWRQDGLESQGPDDHRLGKWWVRSPGHVGWHKQHGRDASVGRGRNNPRMAGNECPDCVYGARRLHSQPTDLRRASLDVALHHIGKHVHIRRVLQHDQYVQDDGEWERELVGLVGPHLWNE